MKYECVRVCACARRDRGRKNRVGGGRKTLKMGLRDRMELPARIESENEYER